MADPCGFDADGRPLHIGDRVVLIEDRGVYWCGEQGEIAAPWEQFGEEPGVYVYFDSDGPMRYRVRTFTRRLRRVEATLTDQLLEILGAKT